MVRAEHKSGIVTPKSNDSGRCSEDDVIPNSRTLCFGSKVRLVLKQGSSPGQIQRSSKETATQQPLQQCAGDSHSRLLTFFCISRYNGHQCSRPCGPCSVFIKTQHVGLIIFSRTMSSTIPTNGLLDSPPEAQANQKYAQVALVWATGSYVHTHCLSWDHLPNITLFTRARFCIFAWDWLLCLSQEYKLIWKGKMTASLLF